MKFAVAVVLFALALGAQSSIVPLVVQHPGSVSVQAAVKTVEVPSAVQLITTHGHPGVIAHAAHVPAVVQVVAAPAPHPAQAVIVSGPAPAHVPAAVQVVAVPPAPHAVVVAAPAHEGTYVAKTRGSVHVAPLPGHANSAASVNLEPAPGTH